MAFDPATYYTLAEEMRLKASTDGPYLRAMLSRAYYSALICARDAKSIPPATKGTGSHEAIIQAYMGIDAQNDQLADHLNDLKTLRVKADYQPGYDLKPDEGLTALSKAKWVLRTLGRLPPKTTP